ncbi:uncharacterized protein BX663DRAFT_527673, partial [Cokeromyces recurvatus]|uniref:uncharacterized protein n=1 Tax=Cokeromyces recurvatus TaxID=90255 RepID=UPI00221E99B6
MVGFFFYCIFIFLRKTDSLKIAQQICNWGCNFGLICIWVGDCYFTIGNSDEDILRWGIYEITDDGAMVNSELFQIEL